LISAFGAVQIGANFPTNGSANAAAIVALIVAGMGLVASVVLLGMGNDRRIRSKVFDDAYGVRWLEPRKVNRSFVPGAQVVAQWRMSGQYMNPAAMLPG